MESHQFPRLENAPEAVGTHGPRVVSFVEKCGVSLFEWQKYVLDGLFAVDAAGKWAASEFGALVARQNGKGEVLVAYTLAHLFLFPRPDNRRKTIIYTAHESKTAADGFARIRGVIDSVPALADRVAHTYTANGQESIVMKPRQGQSMGDRVKFIARSKNSGRGFSADILIQDEAQEESEAAHAALTYTQSAVPNRQEVFFGTVPEDGVNDGVVFEGVRDRGRSGAESTGWMEWTPEGSEVPGAEIDFSDEANWLVANPSAPHLIPLDVIASQLERDTSPGAEIFGRERLSIWPNRAEAAAVAVNDVDFDAWASQVVPERPEAGVASVVLAPVVADGAGYGSIAAAWRLLDGRVYVEHLDTRPQTAWIPARLRELWDELSADSIVMDERKNAPIIAGLAKERLKFLKMNATEVAAAYAMTVEQINAGQVAHRDQEEVTISFRFAKPRKVGSYGFTWEPSNPAEPVTQAQAVTNALWGVNNLEAKPVRRGIVRGYGG